MIPDHTPKRSVWLTWLVKISHKKHPNVGVNKPADRYFLFCLAFSRKRRKVFVEFNASPTVHSSPAVKWKMNAALFATHTVARASQMDLFRRCCVQQVITARQRTSVTRESLMVASMCRNLDNLDRRQNITYMSTALTAIKLHTDSQHCGMFTAVYVCCM